MHQQFFTEAILNQFLTAFLSAALLVGSFSNNARADGVTIDQLKTQAEAEYSMRDYTPQGVAHAQASMAKYSQLLKMTNDADLIAQFNLGVVKANYFIGDNGTDKAAQKQIFQDGMNLIDVVLKNYGIADTKVTTLTDALAQSLTAQYSGNKVKMDILAEAIYQKSANLGQWGQTDVVGALFRWPELRNIVDFLTKLSYASTDASGKATLVSYKSIHGFAAYRVVGRGFYVIPVLLGGDKAKAEKYLELAFKSSMAVDASGKTLGFSTNGYNNIYYTDILRSNNKAAQAKAILAAFVAADPKDAKVFPSTDELVDVLKTQKDARDILNKL